MNIRAAGRILPFVLLLAARSPLAAQESRQLLENSHLGSAAHLKLRLHGGEYHIRTATDGTLRLFEERRAGRTSGRQTDVRFHATAAGATLEIDPPTGHDGPRITLAVPACAALDLELTAGELVFESVPCEATEVNLHAGELRASLGDEKSYRAVKASVTIGEVDARGLGPGGVDAQHGGFFRSFARSDAGSRSFLAHIGTGQITLEGRMQ